MYKGLQWKWLQGLFLVGIVCTILGLMLLADAPTAAQEKPQYVGVKECNDCHRETANNHELSAHALTLIDPSDDSEKISGDFTQANPLLLVQLPNEAEPRMITIDDIAYAVGSGRRYQQYLIEVEAGVYRVLPFTWNVETASWQALNLPDYDWNGQCTSCHVTGYDFDKHDWVDNAVQCEACHGAGEAHVNAVVEADWEIAEQEAILIREAIIAEPDAESCATCHNANLNDGIHIPTMDFMSGETLLTQIAGRHTAHATALDAPDCLSCHVSMTSIEGEELTDHRMNLSLYEQSTVCTDCHAELTTAYAERFITGQQADTSQRLAVIQSQLDVESSPQWLLDTVNLLEADSSAGVHNVAYTEALLNTVEVQLGLVEQSALFSENTASNPTECRECHSEAYADWLGSSHALASLNEHFQSVYSENGQPTYCLRCHASGFDASTQSIHYEGVVCSSCHTAEGEHPPAPITMGTNVTTCASCHSGGHASVYEEWLASEHSAVGVDCVDCHNAHTNDMLLGDVNTTCGDCHANAMNDEVHMGEDLICTDCHMTPRQTVTDPTMLTQTGHSMGIELAVCADCHGEIHSLSLSQANGAAEPDALETLQHEVDEWQDTAEQNLSSGLIGGAVGVILLLGLVYLVLRLGRSS